MRHFTKTDIVDYYQCDACGSVWTMSEPYITICPSCNNEICHCCGFNIPELKSWYCSNCQKGVREKLSKVLKETFYNDQP